MDVMQMKRRAKLVVNASLERIHFTTDWNWMGQDMRHQIAISTKQCKRSTKVFVCVGVREKVC